MSQHLRLRFCRSNSLMLFCSSLHAHFITKYRLLLALVIRSNWQNSHQFESVRTLNHSFRGIGRLYILSIYIYSVELPVSTSSPYLSTTCINPFLYPLHINVLHGISWLYILSISMYSVEYPGSISSPYQYTPWNILALYSLHINVLHGISWLYILSISMYSMEYPGSISSPY